MWQKKTGQKRPKKTDFEVNPAADSILCSTPTHNTIPPTPSLSTQSAISEYRDTCVTPTTLRKTSAKKSSLKRSLYTPDRQHLNKNIATNTKKKELNSKIILITAVPSRKTY